MNAETVEAIKKALEPVAVKLGQGAEQVFALAIRRNLFFATVDAVVAVIFLLAAVALVVFALRDWRDAQVRYAEECAAWERRERGGFKPSRCHFIGYEEPSARFWMCLIAGVLICAMGFPAFHAADRFVNPEWRAVGDIVAAVK